jgi:hypothetical protein
MSPFAAGRRSSLVVSMAVVAGLAAAPRARAADRFEKLVPADAWAFVSVSDATTIQSKFRASAYYRIWQEKEVQKFLEKPLAQLQVKKDEFRNEFGFSIDDLLSLPQGQIALALMPPRKAGDLEDVSGVLLVDVGSNAGRLRDIVSKATDKAVSAGAKRTEKEFGGEKTVILDFGSVAGASESKPAEGEAGEGEGQSKTSSDASRSPDALKEIAYALPGSLFVAGTNAADVEKVLTNLKSHSIKCLADEDDFQRSLRHVSPSTGGPDVVVYAPLGAILDGSNLPKDTEQGLQVTGLRTVRTLTMSVNLEPDLARWSFFAGTRGEKTALLRLISTKGSALNVSKLVPEDVVSAGAVSFDFVGFLTDLESALQAKEPEAYSAYQGFVQELKTKTGLDFKADFLGSFGGEMGFFTRPATGAAGPIPVTPFVLLFSHKGKERLEQAVGKLLALSPQPLFTKRDYNGVAINELSLGGAGGGMPSPAYAITDDQLLVSISATGIEDVIRRIGKDVPSLVDDPRYRAAVAALPPSRSAIQFSDDAKSIESSFESLRSVLFMLGGMGQAADWVDFALLPQASMISKHLGYSGMAVTQDDGGILLVTNAYSKK